MNIFVGDDQYGTDDTGNDPIPNTVKPPSILGEEDPFSGDATNSESPDIDEELAKVGLTGDTAGSIAPLGLQEELEDEVE